MKLYYDFHIHSALSPCAGNDMTPNNIVNMAALKGLDAIAVTDHNSAKNVRAVMSAGEKSGIRVIAGMEIETAEEVHILSLFPSAEAAENAAAVVALHLPPLKNNAEIFGMQLVMDSCDNILYEENQLLLTATALSVEQVFELVRGFGGVPIPAHVDRGSFSVLSNLGFIPDGIGVTSLEISAATHDVPEYFENHSELRSYSIIRNSDAHSLGELSERINFIEVSDNKIEKILSKFI